LVKANAPPVAAFKFGDAIHYGVQKYLMKEHGSVVQGFEEKWDPLAEELVEESFSSREKDWGYLASRGVILSAKFEYQLESLKVGTPFLTLDGKYAIELQDKVAIAKGVVLTRSVDYMGPVSGTPFVIDFKTAAQAYSEGKDEVMSEQLTAYLFPHEFKGIPQMESAAFLVGTKTMNPEVYWLPTKRSERRRSDYVADLKSVAAMIRNNIFYRNRNKFRCPYCPYYLICYEDLTKEELRHEYTRLKPADTQRTKKPITRRRRKRRK